MKYITSGYQLPHIVLPRLVIKEKRHDRSTDRDHEHDPIIRRIEHTISRRPESWSGYSDLTGAVIMEYGEFMTCRSDGDQDGMERELIELAAACICAIKEMK